MRNGRCTRRPGAEAHDTADTQRGGSETREVARLGASFDERLFFNRNIKRLRNLLDSPSRTRTRWAIASNACAAQAHRSAAVPRRRANHSKAAECPCAASRDTAFLSKDTKVSPPSQRPS